MVVDFGGVRLLGGGVDEDGGDGVIFFGCGREREGETTGGEGEDKEFGERGEKLSLFSGDF